MRPKTRSRLQFAGCLTLILLFIVLPLYCLTHAAATASDCIGIDDYLELSRPQRKQFAMSTPNVAAGLLAFETIIIPVWVGLDATYCPRGE